MFSFDLQEFLLLLERYNLEIWPLQIVAYLLGVLVIILSFRKSRTSDKLILITLSFYWLWTGIVFCSLYWAPTYEFAYGFSVLFIIQGILFLYAVIGSNFAIHFNGKFNSILGLVFIIYAMAGYQVLGYFIGHTYPKFFAFGMVPCPTTIFTIGLFLFADRKLPIYLIIIPFIIAVSGSIAVYNGIWEDVGLIVAGVLGMLLIFNKKHKKYS